MAAYGGEVGKRRGGDDPEMIEEKGGAEGLV